MDEEKRRLIRGNAQEEHWFKKEERSESCCRLLEEKIPLSLFVRPNSSQI